MDTAELEEIAEALYGDGAFTVVKSLSEKQRKDRNFKAMENAAIATNAVGMVAGPAALYSAVRHRKQGGIPRDLMDSAANAMQNRKSKGQVRPRSVRIAGMKARKITNALNRPGTPKQAVAAGAAGAGLIGLQAINWSGDTISTKLLNDQKKSREVKKSDEIKAEPKQLRAVRLGHKAVFTAAKVPEKIREVKPVTKSLDVVWHGEISKMDTDKRQVFGWASIVEIDGKPVIDLQGDYMTVDEIEKAAYDYVKSSRKGGHQHQKTDDGPKHVSDMIESFLVTDEKKRQMGLPDSTPTGWWVGFQVNDDDVWAQVKDGKLPGFSIHGSGTRKSVEVDG